MMKRVSGNNKDIDCSFKEDYKRFVDIMTDTLVNEHKLGFDSEVIELLRPSQIITDEYEHNKLISALGTNHLYATVSNNSKLEVFTSPLLLRHFMNTLKRKNHVIVLFRELLELLGLNSDQPHRSTNISHTKNLFEKVCLVTDKLRRTYLYQDLRKNCISIDRFYESTALRLMSDTIYCEQSYVKSIEIGSDFPSDSDSADMQTVRDYITNKAGFVIVPKSNTQMAYDYGFVTFNDYNTYLQVVNASCQSRLRKSNETNNKYLKAVKKELVEKVVTNIKAVSSLPWDKLGLNIYNIIHTFIFCTNTSHIDWNKELAKHLDISTTKIIILDQNSLDVQNILVP